MDISEQILAIEKEIRETPHHKGTEHHIGRLRARIARLKDKIIDEEVRSKSGGGGVGYAVRHQGDATIILIGPPSAGKSTLINKLTNTQSKVAPYAFTTLSVIPGMMYYKNARIQILDVPGLIEGAEEGKGRGREVLSVARGTNLAIIMTDIKRIESIERIEAALQRNGIRLNIVRPNVSIEKKSSGGLIIHSNFKQDYDIETIKLTASEFGLKNAEITIKEKLTIERLFDAFSLNRVYIPSINLINKIDEAKNLNDIYSFCKSLNPVYISAEKGIGLEDFKEAIWNKLNFITIYLVGPESNPDFNHPFIAKKSENLYDIGSKIASDFMENKKAAQIWGSSAKFAGQEVSFSTKIAEGMQVRFI